MNILSIQSTVAYGHVGNSAAVPVLQFLGHDAWPVATVSFSNHPEHGRWTGRVIGRDETAEIVDGLADLGVLARCDAVLSGYLGSAGNGEVLLDAVSRVRAANADALFCLDPVIGNEDKGVFVDPALPGFFRDRAIGQANIVVPNRFELAQLTGRDTDTATAARDAARSLLALGPRIVVTTGLRDGDRIGTLACTADHAWLATTPYVSGVTDIGAGDVITAIFLARYLESRDVPAALTHATAATCGIIRRTRELGRDELAIVAARAELTAPSLEAPVASLD